MSNEFILGLRGLRPEHRGCVATIGSFDGVHLGHQQVLQQVKARALQLGVPSLVMVFEPQPNEFFAKHDAPARLMRLREKVAALFSAGIDRVLCLKFDQALRGLTAEQFIQSVLVDGIGVKHLVIGDDFRFGCDRAGDFALLVKSGEQLGFQVTDTITYTGEDSLASSQERVSSTRIRTLLEQDDLAQAEALLGKPYSITARVFHGKQLGRSIGFPTANLGLGRFHSPVFGVYAVSVKIPGQSQPVNGVANVGTRPTVSGDKKTLLEVHLLDFSENLYGKCLAVTFHKKIRNEMRFDGVPSLKAQIAQDVADARAFFTS